MPTSRAPTRLTAVARSALPVSVRSKNRKSRKLKIAELATIRMLWPGHADRPEVEERPRHRLGAEAFRSEIEQREAGYREVNRDRDDQQDQHRCVGERTKRDAIEQRRDRQNDREGQRDAEPHRQVAPGGEPDQRRRDDRAARRTAAAPSAGGAAAPRRISAVDFHHGRKRGQRQHQPHRARHLPQLQRRERERRIADDVAERDEDDARDQEDQHDAEARPAHRSRRWKSRPAPEGGRSPAS